MSVEYDLDVRAHPEAYCYRRGEQGVCKLPPTRTSSCHWGFKDEETAEEAVSPMVEA